MGTLADKGNVNWVSHTRKLIQNINLPLEGVTLDNRKCFSDLAWDTLAEVAMTSWHQSIWDPKACSSESGGRLALYRVFKSLPGTEEYAKLNLPVHIRRVMAGLRMGSLPLQIETGRYTNTPAANRICKLCHLEIEDQYHFLLICPLLRQEILHLFNAIAKLDSNANFMVMNPSEKLYYLLNSGNLTGTICRLIAKMFRKRQSIFLKS